MDTSLSPNQHGGSRKGAGRKPNCGKLDWHGKDEQTNASRRPSPNDMRQSILDNFGDRVESFNGQIRIRQKNDVWTAAKSDSLTIDSFLAGIELCKTCRSHVAGPLMGHLQSMDKERNTSIAFRMNDKVSAIRDFSGIGFSYGVSVIGPEDYVTETPTMNLWHENGEDLDEPAIVQEVFRDSWEWDEDTIEYLRKAFANSASDGPSLEKAINLVSATRTGKGTLTDILAKVFGKGMTTINANTWDKYSSSQIEGKAIVRINEAETSSYMLVAAMRESLGENYNVRGMYQGHKTIRFNGMWLLTSTQPIVNLNLAAGDADRVVFAMTKAPRNDNPDPNFKARLTSDEECVKFFWWLQGANPRAKPSDQMLEDTVKQQAESDPMVAAINDCIREQPGSVVRGVQNIRERYMALTGLKNFKQQHTKQLESALENMSFGVTKDGRKWVIQNAAEITNREDNDE